MKRTGQKLLPISDDRDVFSANSSSRKVTAPSSMMCLGETHYSAVDLDVFGQRASLASYDFFMLAACQTKLQGSW